MYNYYIAFLIIFLFIVVIGFFKNIETFPFVYYCQIDDDKCIKKYANNKSDAYCGMYQLYNRPAKIFNTYEECHNYNNKYEDLTKEECLDHSLNINSMRGWCTDYLGNGKCVEGTPEGPVDILRYNMCLPTNIHNNPNNRNVYTY